MRAIKDFFRFNRAIPTCEAKQETTLVRTCRTACQVVESGLGRITLCHCFGYIIGRGSVVSVCVFSEPVHK